MTEPRRRRRVWLIGAALLAALLFGGRWLAVESSERAWAASLVGGEVYLQARALARVVRVAMWVLATLWGVGNLFIVYRSIGSVQMPRRLGNLEIAEQVPKRLLLALAIGAGLLFGIGLVWGTGDWWQAYALATAEPHFGVLDPILHKDVGYYVATLPWALAQQGFFFLSTVSATLLVGFLYLGIGAVRFHQGRLLTSSYARSHLSLLLAAVAAAVLWGAVLDPAEVVAGLHGTFDGPLASVRLPGAPVVLILALITAIISLAWTWWDRPRWLGTSWALLAAAMLGVYALLPSIVRSARQPGPRGQPPPPAFASERAQFTALAYGIERRPSGLESVPQYASLPDLVAHLPLWDSTRIAAATRPWLRASETVAGVALQSVRSRWLWLVARAPDDTALARAQPEPTWSEVHRGAWAAAGAPLGFVETDSGPTPAPLSTRDSVTYFGPGFSQYAVVARDGPRPAPVGVRLRGRWRRIALAWELQSPELARAATEGDLLLWRRDPVQRLEQLAPFATFDRAEPLLLDGALWWVSYGYLGSEAFPLSDAITVEPGHETVRYQRWGFVGAVRATTGDTRLWLAPGADSLAAAWARLFQPLVAPEDSLPPALRVTLRFPRRSFDIAVARFLAAPPDSEGWSALQRAPVDVPVPGSEAPWLVQGLEAHRPARMEGMFVGTAATAAEDPQLILVPPPAADLAPSFVGGVGNATPGALRMWIASGHMATLTARFVPGTGRPRVESVFLTWGNQRADGGTLTSTLRDLLAAGSPGTADTSLAALWGRAQQLAARADSALEAKDLERFGALYHQLTDLLLGFGRRKLAPVPLPH